MVDSSTELATASKKTVSSFLRAFAGVDFSPSEDRHQAQGSRTPEQKSKMERSQTKDASLKDHIKSSTSSNSHPGPSTQYSQGPATPEQVLGWLLEHLELLGATASYTSWNPEEFSSMFSVSADDSSPSSSTELPPDDSDLNAALGRMIRDVTREQWLKKTTHQHQALYPQVHELVASKLAARGVPKSRLHGLSPGKKLELFALTKQNDHNNSNLSLRQSPPAVENVSKFIVYLVITKDPRGNSRDSTKLHFEWDTAFVRFLCVLRDTSSYAARRTGRKKGGYELPDGPWYYQLVGNDKQTVHGSKMVPIADEEGYWDMIKELKWTGLEMVSISHVCLFVVQHILLLFCFFFLPYVFSPITVHLCTVQSLLVMLLVSLPLSAYLRTHIHTITRTPLSYKPINALLRIPSFYLLFPKYLSLFQLLRTPLPPKTPTLQPPRRHLRLTISNNQTLMMDKNNRQ